MDTVPDFHEYLSKVLEDEHQRYEIAAIQEGCPFRKVGARALLAHRVRFFSKKNCRGIDLESGTVEKLFALELELDDRVIAYFPQPRIGGIRRGNQVVARTLDFLVYRTDGVEVVECKPFDVMERLAKSEPEEWTLTTGGWRRPFLDAWADSYGVKSRVWVAPKSFPVYENNLQALYDHMDADLTQSEAKALDRSVANVSKGAVSIAALQSAHPSLNFRAVLNGLARRRWYGLLHSTLLDDLEGFLLFCTQDGAEIEDSRRLELASESLTELNALNPILTASVTDINAGRRRLKRLEAMERGEVPFTKRYLELHRRVKDEGKKGVAPLEACLTQYAKSGWRGTKLSANQEAALKEVIGIYSAGRHCTVRHVYIDLAKRCQDRGIRCPSLTTLAERIRRETGLSRVLNTEGRRGFHSRRPPIDPRLRTLPALQFGAHAHVDSTKFDVRCFVELGEQLGVGCPLLYVAVDDATRIPLGMALGFGPSCRDALGILIRDVRHRQGFIPRRWTSDGGSEYTSHWFRGFLDATGSGWTRSPGSGAQFNELAENILGRVNGQVARHLAGSTLNDQRGRKVDNCFKSRKTVRHLFGVIAKACEDFLFEDVPRTPGLSAHGDPSEHLAALVDDLGHGGVETPFDDNFIILTSPVLERCPKIDARKGIRFEGRTYSSPALFSAANAERGAIEVRRDCVDPSRIYVKFKYGWVTAFSADVTRISLLSSNEKVFEYMNGAGLRAKNRRKQTLVAIARSDRIERANATSSETVHLRPSEKALPEVVVSAWESIGDELDLEDAREYFEHN